MIFYSSLFLCDQILKYNIYTHRNYGIDQGIMLKNSTICSSIALILSYYYCMPSILLCGGVSNTFDRLIYGYVRDYIHLNIYNYNCVFNLADIYITIGCIQYIVYKLN